VILLRARRTDGSPLLRVSTSRERLRDGARQPARHLHADDGATLVEQLVSDHFFDAALAKSNGTSIANPMRFQRYRFEIRLRGKTAGPGAPTARSLQRASSADLWGIAAALGLGQAREMLTHNGSGCGGGRRMGGPCRTMAHSRDDSR
jgi:hypothetical protein